MGLLAAAAVCSIAAPAWIVAGARLFQPKAPVDPLAALTLPKPDLVLQEASVHGESAHLKVTGVVVNKSDRVVTNVSLTFNLTRGIDNVGAVRATVSRLAGHGASRFETDEFAESGVEPVLKEMTVGNP